MIRNFANGFLAGLACFCLLGLLWLLAIRPQLTQLQSDHLREEFLLAGPEAERFGALPFSEPLLDLEAMQKQYPDLRAWLTIPGTCVDYPVLQSSSAQPEYYLRRDINGKWRMAGSLFFQSDCQPQSRNLVVFGHNMTDGTMFGSLPDYHQEVFRKEHETIILQTIDTVYVYQVIAVLETDTAKIPFNRTSFANDADFLAFEKGLLESSVFANGHVPSSEDRLLTLVTCSYAWDGARYVVVAVRE